MVVVPRVERLERALRRFLGFRARDVRAIAYPRKINGDRTVPLLPARSFKVAEA